MRTFRNTRSLFFSTLSAALVLGACSAPAPGDGADDFDDEELVIAAGSSDGAGAAPGKGGLGDGAGAGKAADGTPIDPDKDPDIDGILPDGTSTEAAIPARIRRLTNAEYTASVRSLLGTEEDPGSTFPPDLRQQGYTVNEAQRVDPLLAKQLDSVAKKLAAAAIAGIDELAPCADAEAGGEACASEFAEAFATKAYRRPLEEGELDALLSLYRAGEEGGSYPEGIELLIRGVLQTPAFLYLTEIGDGTESGTIPLTSFELASALSYLLTGGPPDDELSALAASGELSSPEAREVQVRRLLDSGDGGQRLVRVVREWLGLDRIFATSKDSNVHPDFEALRQDMGQETEDFVLEVLKSEQGNVGALLGADWTMASAPLASMYGASGEGRVETPDRRGLLNQGAFLSVYSHAQETGPVLRGVAVMRRVACRIMELPTDLDVEIIPPVPDPEKTTRERFEIHSIDPGCQGCHSQIDPLGFSFEHLDAMGAFRSEENSRPVDSAVEVVLGNDFDGEYASSSELALALSESQEVKACFARQLFRATAGEGTGALASEEAFVKAWGALPASDQGSIIEILVTMAKSNLFSHRGEE